MIYLFKKVAGSDFLLRVFLRDAASQMGTFAPKLGAHLTPNVSIINYSVINVFLIRFYN